MKIKNDEECQILSPAEATNVSKLASELDDHITAESHLPLGSDFAKELSLMEEFIAPLHALHPLHINNYNYPLNSSPSIGNTVRIVSLANKIISSTNNSRL